MIKKIGLFLIFFMIAVFTGLLFLRSLNEVIAIKTPIVIENSENVQDKKAKNEIIDEIVESEKEIKAESQEDFEISEELEEVVEKAKPFSFVVLADAETYKTPGRHNDILEHMLAKAASYRPNFAVFTGDLVASDFPDKNRLRNLKKLIEKYYEKYYHTFGKHDIECGVKCIDAWQEVFYNKGYESGEERILYHSFDYENTHFVLLSTEYPIKHSIDDKQLKWLDEDLANTDKDHVIVTTHVPPVNFFKESAKECHDMTCSEPQRTKLMNILRKHRVDLVISGHEHVFDHKIVDGTDFILAGNSGNGKRYKDSTWEDSFSLISVTKYGINLKALGADGHLIREIKIK